MGGKIECRGDHSARAIGSPNVDDEETLSFLLHLVYHHLENILRLDSPRLGLGLGKIRPPRRAILSSRHFEAVVVYVNRHCDKLIREGPICERK
jgi:hypothetical protein